MAGRRREGPVGEAREWPGRDFLRGPHICRHSQAIFETSLEHAIIEARDAAEVGARAALEALAVHHHEPYPHMDATQRELRKHLRARARQLGDRRDTTGRLAIDHLAAECAYEQWHRMLFARFLAENGLLIEPEENMAISLAEAEELAKEEGLDVWVFASRCAQDMLPQIFRPDDPLLQVSFATEHRIKLERLLAILARATLPSDPTRWGGSTSSGKARRRTRSIAPRSRSGRTRSLL